MAQDQPTPPRRTRRTLRRVLLGLGVGLVLLVVGVALLGPTIAGALVPWAAARVHIPGRLEVQRATLSWTGVLAVEHATLKDAQGDTIAHVSLRTTGGLLGLLGGTLQNDATIDGWANITLDEQGLTNIEHALGLTRSQAPTTSTPTTTAQPNLPFARIILDGLDLAVTGPNTRTVGIAQLKGEATAQGHTITLRAQGHLVERATPPAARDDITNAPNQGQLTAHAEYDLSTQTGQATIALAGLTTEAAKALAGLTGSAQAVEFASVSARGGLDIDLHTALQAGAPQQATLRFHSQTIDANLTLATTAGVLALEQPGRLEIGTAAYLANDTLRALALPTEGVTVSQAGRLTITLETLTIPMQGAVPDMPAASGTLRLELGRTMLTVPGPDGQPVQVRANALSAALTKAPDSPTLAFDATLRAGLVGQPDGVLTLAARAKIPDTADANPWATTPRALTQRLPHASLKLEQMPTLAARPWLAAIESLGLNIHAILGAKVDATLDWDAGTEGQALVAWRVAAPHARAQGQASWSDDAIALTTPLELHLARPSEALKPWLPTGWVMGNGQGITLHAQELQIPMQGPTPQWHRASARIEARADNLRLQAPDQPSLDLPNAVLALHAQGDAATLQLTAAPTIDAVATNLHANLNARGFQALTTGQWPTILGDITLDAPTQLAGLMGTVVADRPLEAWAREALGPTASLTLTLQPPEPGRALTGQLAIHAQHATLTTTDLHATTAGITLGGTTLHANPSEALWKSLAPLANMPGSTLHAQGPLVVTIGTITLPFDGQPLDPATILAATTLDAKLPNPWTLSGLQVGPSDGAVLAQVVIQNLAASVNSLGGLLANSPDTRATLDLDLATADQAPIGTLRAVATVNQQQGLDATIIADQLDPALAFALAGTSTQARDALQGALGRGGRIELHASASHATQGPYNLRTATLDVQTPRLKTAQPIRARFTDEAIAIEAPAAIAWHPDADWLESAIGARVMTAEPFQISLDRVELGNPLAGGVLLSPEHAWLNASIKSDGATITIPNRPDIVLQTIEASHHRVGPGQYAIKTHARSTGGVIDLNGLVQNLTDDQGQPDLDKAIFRGTLRGDDVPVAIADAMTNSDGLLAEILGDVVDLDAEINDGRLIPGTPPSAEIRLSIRGPRAQASAFGRLENHVITMPQPQTILTIREVRPEVSARFAQIIPELLLVEKRPEDGPAVVRTQGLSIPTDGQWQHAQGDITIALGTARFRSSSLLAGVLKATGQREQGAVGQRIEPIEIAVTKGVLTYKPFDLPLGDLKLHSEGTVNLADNTMDVIVWIPMAALSDEAAGRFKTGLGSALGRAIPGLGTITTVPWRIAGPIDKPAFRPAPNVLLERSSDAILGPLLNPGQTISDLLGLPTKREKPKEGG